MAGAAPAGATGAPGAAAGSVAVAPAGPAPARAAAAGSAPGLASLLQPARASAARQHASAIGDFVMGGPLVAGRIGMEASRAYASGNFARTGASAAGAASFAAA
ncbi:MAG: hypothetical protein EXR79_02450 [Myxococcales bacterium]|nr:hypothetical protein [Myxococcales bacterium]